MAASRDRLLPQIIEDIAHEEPDSVFVALPKNDDISSGVKEVTAGQLARAIDRAAWFLQKTVGRSRSFETLTYIGPHDLRYPILSVAAPKVGYKSFFVSPRNSLEGQLNLFRETHCSLLLTPATLPAGVAPLFEKLQLRHVVVPGMEDWLDDRKPVDRYPFSKTYESSYLDPYMVIHTSGSTGLPKPMTLPYSYFTICQAYTESPDEDGVKTLLAYMRERPGRIFLPFPFFHVSLSMQFLAECLFRSMKSISIERKVMGAGIHLFYTFALFLRQIPVVLPPKPMTAQLADDYHRSGQVTSSFLPPAILEEISRDNQMTQNLRRLKFVMVSGAPLSRAIGDKVRPHVRILNFIGQTESGMLPHLYVEDEDRLYVRFFKRLNMEMRHRTEDLYEAVIKRQEGCERFQPAFMVAPHLEELGMNDLFSRHPDPSKSDHWIHRGRGDDIIVLDNGEKINPISMEQLISTHPKIKAAMVVGEYRFQPAILIELVDIYLSSLADRAALVEEIWPVIEQANVDSPAHGRLVQELVVFVEPAMPLLRTSKGSLQRRATEAMYRDRLDQAYTTMEEKLTFALPAIEVRDIGLKEDLREILQQATSLRSLADDDDFFMSGMDSLLVLKLFRALKQSLRRYPRLVEKIAPSIIYRNPSLDSLTLAVYSLMETAGGTEKYISQDAGSDAGRRAQRQKVIDSVLEVYAKDLPSPVMSALIPKKWDGKHVILTGSTGGFGTYILAALMLDPTISHIYCLNRSSNAWDRQAAVHKSYGLPSPLFPGRVTFIQCDFSRKNLGLQTHLYTTLVGSVTDIIHNAWTVNFNQHLSSYGPTMIAGLRYLIDLAAESAYKARIYFISSLGTVVRWKAAGKPGDAPEELNDDLEAVEEMGYTESKHVAEHLLSLASEKSKLQTCIVRVGQIAGPVNSSRGHWNRAEWLPRLITSSLELGMVPSSLGSNDVVEWVPVDLLANALLELLDGPIERGTTPVYHLVNPIRTTWQTLYPVVHQRLGKVKGYDIKLVDYGEWLAGLEEAAASSLTEEEIEKNPSLKLVEFFKVATGSTDLTPDFSTKKTQAKSKTLRNCGPVTPEWMELWMRQWGY